MMLNKELDVCQLHILVLCDGAISYDFDFFGLSTFLQMKPINTTYTLHIYPARRDYRPRPPLPTSRCAGVYRQQPGEAKDGVTRVYEVMYGFRFKPDQQAWHHGKLHEFVPDEVWFFGENPSEQNMPDKAEMNFLYAWMERGRVGVFATGDHGKRGVNLCGRIPRVRHMRSWFSGIPNRAKHSRNSSIVPWPGFSGTLEEDLQYDDLPMKLKVRRYGAQCHGPFTDLGHGQPQGPLGARGDTFPHPIFSARSLTQDAIDVLPDHAHEGEVTRVTRASWEALKKNLANTASAEFLKRYPVAYPQEFQKTSGEQDLPWEIVASTVNQDVRGVVERPALMDDRPHEYGVVGAYNGFLAKEPVGRIVVDSSFHHFLDANLCGRPPRAGRPDGTPPTNGFQASAQGRAHLHAFRSYHQNLVLWLMPPQKQREIAALTLYHEVGRPPLNDLLSTDMAVWEIGRATLANLGPVIGDALLRSWWPYFFTIKKFVNLLQQVQTPMGHIMHAVDEYMLGGIVKELLERRTNDLYQPDPQCHKDTNAWIIECAGIGAENGKRAFSAELERFIRHHHGALSALDDLQSRKNPPPAAPSHSIVVSKPPPVEGSR